ncbi:unnamed protein product [Protopolystoma xenopodis]|uniref:Uncharacterized protein n=1 Tax=Protopolystoma xenopodis TaxID=117903 RepID=A0A448XRG8_9PLAT|nr:unnamed protein product [Protopolystoma xenopodis]
MFVFGLLASTIPPDDHLSRLRLGNYSPDPVQRPTNWWSMTNGNAQLCTTVQLHTLTPNHTGTQTCIQTVKWTGDLWKLSDITYDAIVFCSMYLSGLSPLLQTSLARNLTLPLLFPFYVPLWLFTPTPRNYFTIPLVHSSTRLTIQPSRVTRRSGSRTQISRFASKTTM